MTDQVAAPTTLRDVIEQNVEAAEAGVLPTAEERARDEAGRFAKRESAVPAEAGGAPAPEKAAAAPKKEAEAAPEAPAQVPAPIPPQITTWKKEYLPLHQKLAQGIPLTPEEARKIADYAVQRENEYKTGVSTYKAEAMQAKEIQEAVAPFMGELQANGLTPAAWIRDVGQAHYVLVKGTPEQKVQLFNVLAQRYGVPLAAVVGAQQGQGIPPIVSQLMAQNQALMDRLNSIDNRVKSREEQESTLQLQHLQSEVERAAGDSQTYPHFAEVRESMAQLLERGAAHDIPSAYKLAVRLDDGIQKQELDRLLQEKLSEKSAAVAQARSRAVSPKSATPSGTVASAGPKDRRSILAEQLEAAAGGGRV